MSDISFFTDEDVHGELAGILRSSGVDAVSTPETGRLTEPGPAQLEWCHEQGPGDYQFQCRRLRGFTPRMACCGTTPFRDNRFLSTADWRLAAPCTSSRTHADRRRDGRLLRISQRLAFRVTADQNSTRIRRFRQEAYDATLPDVFGVICWQGSCHDTSGSPRIANESC